MKAARIILILSIILLVILSGCAEREASPSLTATALPSNPILSSTPTSTPTPSISPSVTPISPTPSPSTPVQFPPGTDLKWESIGMRTSISDVPGSLSSYPFHVMISPPYLPMEGFTDNEQAAIKAVDFDKYFVLIVIHSTSYPIGYPSKKFEIERIWMDANTIYIQAALPPSFQPGMTYVPQSRFAFQIVKINKDGISPFDRITFKLLDDSARERAATTSLIPR
jgi:hypothetical protein